MTSPKNPHQETAPGSQLSAEVLERFNAKWEVCPDTGCWLWSAAKDGCGYGAIKVCGRQWGAHRLSWTIYRGPIPENLQVLHTCDTPICVCPEHLFLGTCADNMADKMTKKREARGDRHGRSTCPETTARGERVHTARLTTEDVRAIRALADGGVPRATIAEEFGVGVCSVGCVVRRKTWRHVS